MKECTIILKQDKTTKNTVRYSIDESVEAEPIRTVYVDKWFLPKPYPDEIEIVLRIKE